MNAFNLFNAFDARINEGFFFHLTTYYIKQTQITYDKLCPIIIKDFPLHFAILHRTKDMQIKELVGLVFCSLDMLNTVMDRLGNFLIFI